MKVLETIGIDDTVRLLSAITAIARYKSMKENGAQKKDRKVVLPIEFKDWSMQCNKDIHKLAKQRLNIPVVIVGKEAEKILKNANGKEALEKLSVSNSPTRRQTEEEWLHGKLNTLVSYLNPDPPNSKDMMVFDYFKQMSLIVIKGTQFIEILVHTYQKIPKYEISLSKNSSPFDDKCIAVVQQCIREFLKQCKQCHGQEAWQRDIKKVLIIYGLQKASKNFLKKEKTLFPREILRSCIDLIKMFLIIYHGFDIKKTQTVGDVWTFVTIFTLVLSPPSLF